MLYAARITRALGEISMLQAVGSALRITELRRKIFFTLGMLLIYRLIAHIPVPYTNASALKGVLENNQLLGILNLFSGGALQNFSIAAMGVYPYITATIIVQLLQPLIPQLEELSKEGEAGRAKLNLYTHILTVPLAFLQGYGTGVLLQSQGVIEGFGFGPGSDVLSTFAILMS